MLLPLQNVRGNFARIHSALSELMNLSERTSSDGQLLDLTAVQQAVRDAVAMFQRQAQGLLQVCEVWTTQYSYDCLCFHAFSLYSCASVAY